MRSELLVLLCVQESLCFWDEYTTTKKPPEKEEAIRTSFFMWQYVDFQSFLGFKNAPAYDYHVMRCRSLSSIAGISIGFLPITTAAILNRRTLITSANPLEPYIARQEDLRIWALGRQGMWNTPYRYRVYRWRRVLPRSVNPEHQVGARGRFTTRHDIAIVHSRDQMYLYDGPPSRYQYATRVFIADKRATISTNHVFIAGTMTVHNIDIIHGYDINYYDMSREFIVNCEQYLPKYWGKFICMLQRHPPMMGLLSGSTLIVNDKVFAIGAFEIRYNEQRVLVFTDVRYYVDWINIMANISYGEYYDYSYSQWSVKLSAVYDGSGHTNFFPSKYIQYDLWPLGK